MKSNQTITEATWSSIHCILFFLFTWGVLTCITVEQSSAQVSPNTLSFAYTGNPIPIPDGFKPTIPDDGLRVGPLRVHPFLGAAEIYTDNVFRSNTNRQHDFLHVVAPGLQVQLPFARFHQVTLDYRASEWISQRFSGNDVLTQDLTGQLALNFPSGLTFKMQGGYVEGFDLRGEAIDIQLPELTTWNTTSFLGEAEMLGSRAGARVRVGVTNWNFENNNQGPTRDRLNTRGDVTVFGNVMPNTYVLLNFGVTKELYDQNIQLDSTSYRVSTGLRWSATGKTTGEIQVGYEILNFDKAPVLQPAGSLLNAGGDGFEIVQVSGALNWQPTPRSNISISPSRSIQQSAVLGTSVFTQTGVTVNATYGIGVRTNLNGNFRYANEDFTQDLATQASQDRTDNRLEGRIGFTYQAVRWLGITGSYEYQQRTSTLSQFEFYANTLMVSIQGFF